MQILDSINTHLLLEYGYETDTIRPTEPIEAIIWDNQPHKFKSKIWADLWLNSFDAMKEKKELEEMDKQEREPDGHYDLSGQYDNDYWPTYTERKPY